MLLKNKENQDLVKISNLEQLIDPFKNEVEGQIQAGQNEQPPEAFDKEKLIFLSGESLPQCWLNADYRAE